MPETCVLTFKVLRRAMSANADSLQGWQLLSQLQLQNGQADLAAESAGKGLQCLAQRCSRGYQPLPQTAAEMVLARGHSLLALDCLDDAHAMYNALTGWFVLTSCSLCGFTGCLLACLLACCCVIIMCSCWS